MSVQLCPSCISSAVAVKSIQVTKASIFNPPPKQYLEGDGLDLFVFNFVDVSPVPKIIGFRSTPSKYAISLNVSLDNSGTITCGAFQPFYYPDSVSDIQIMGYPGRQGNNKSAFFIQ